LGLEWPVLEGARIVQPRSVRDELQYDVCLSFAGEDRQYVEEVADHLSSLGVRVFYDRYEVVELWGKDLYAHLDDVYQNAAKYCVLFISEHYARKLWPSHERRSAQARALREHQEYILPARFDETEVPGMPSTIGYVDLTSRSPTEFAELIRQKLGDKERRNYFPPYPDRLIARIVADRESEEVDEEVVLSQAHSFYEVFGRMSPEERAVVANVFLNGCPAELPENVHISIDLLRRCVGFPQSKILRLLGGVRSLGFYVQIRDETHEHDEYLGDMKYVYLEWNNLHTFGTGNATDIACHVISGAVAGYCEMHGLEAVARMDFSQLASPTQVTDEHS
jgi:hypothetical protein